MILHPDELNRYGRQMMMDGWGEAAQERLKRSTVFVAGAGGLGSPVSMYLAVAGVGHLRLCDFDSPELSNLNRQILHDPSRIGINKAISGKTTLERLNNFVPVEAVTEKIDETNVDRLVAGADVIIDCMDNFPTRYLLNDAALRAGVPFVFGAVRGMEGRLTSIRPGKTACLRCIFPEAPPKEVFPIVGATPGVIGSLQALEAIKHITGVGKPLAGRLLVWDGTEMEFSTFKTYRDPACVSCGVKVAVR